MNCLLFLYKVFFACNGVPLVTAFVRNSKLSEDAQLWGLRAIWQFRTLKQVMTKCRTDPTVPIPPQRAFSPAIPIHEPERPFAWYVDYLATQKPISVECINLLFEILTGNVQHIHAQKKVARKYIVEKEFLPVLCNACSKATTEAGLQALRTFTLLLKESENCNIVC